MQIEIGSNFWTYSLCERRERKLWWESEEYSKIFLKSGRNAFKAICNYISADKRKVLFPAYHCGTESEPWYESDWEVEYYPIENNFTVDANKLKQCIIKAKPAVLVIQSYYGFDALNDECNALLQECMNKGIIIIEDITQSILSDIRHQAVDYYIASLRKFFAIPDGGVLISRQPIAIRKIAQGDNNIPLNAMQAYSLKREYFETKNKGIKEEFRAAYVVLNELISVNDNNYAMSDVSLKIWNSFDFTYIAQKRRENYRTLSEGLAKIDYLAITRTFDSDTTVPLFLPVLVKNNTLRQELQAFLAEKDIYCPIIWKKSPRIVDCPKETSAIYERILCFPIDQRYDKEDMFRIFNTVEKWNV